MCAKEVAGTSGPREKERNVSGAVLNSLTREELEAENARLRAALIEAGVEWGTLE
ncbi:hypothetical protein JCM16408A_55710 [Methylobacterium phyllosphaerae]